MHVRENGACRLPPEDKNFVSQTRTEEWRVRVRRLRLSAVSAVPGRENFRETHPTGLIPIGSRLHHTFSMWLYIQPY